MRELCLFGDNSIQSQTRMYTCSTFYHIQFVTDPACQGLTLPHCTYQLYNVIGSHIDHLCITNVDHRLHRHASRLNMVELDKQSALIHMLATMPHDQLNKCTLVSNHIDFIINIAQSWFKSGYNF